MDDLRQAVDHVASQRRVPGSNLNLSSLTLYRRRKLRNRRVAAGTVALLALAVVAVMLAGFSGLFGRNTDHEPVAAPTTPTFRPRPTHPNQMWGLGVYSVRSDVAVPVPQDPRGPSSVPLRFGTYELIAVCQAGNPTTCSRPTVRQALRLTPDHHYVLMGSRPRHVVLQGYWLRADRQITFSHGPLVTRGWEWHYTSANGRGWIVGGVPHVYETYIVFEQR